eukprot:8604976-Pyramimonas_sp.AAC.1
MSASVASSGCVSPAASNASRSSADSMRPMSISMSSLAASSARTCTWPERGTAADATPPPSSSAG